MKRNQTIARRGRSKPAPYTKYGKRPHRYSAEYYSWFAKITKKTAKSQEARAA